MVVSAISDIPIVRIVLGAMLLLVAVLMTVLTVKKPKCVRGKAIIVSEKHNMNESIYHVKCQPSDFPSVPDGTNGEPFNIETARYDNSYRKGEVGDIVEVGWYTIKKEDGEPELKCVITEKGFHVHAQKYVKIYALAIAVGVGLCSWGIVELISH